MLPTYECYFFFLFIQADLVLDKVDLAALLFISESRRMEYTFSYDFACKILRSVPPPGRPGAAQADRALEFGYDPNLRAKQNSTCYKKINKLNPSIKNKHNLNTSKNKL